MEEMTNRIRDIVRLTLISNWTYKK